MPNTPPLFASIISSSCIPVCIVALILLVITVWITCWTQEEKEKDSIFGERRSYVPFFIIIIIIIIIIFHMLTQHHHYQENTRCSGYNLRSCTPSPKTDPPSLHRKSTSSSFQKRLAQPKKWRRAVSKGTNRRFHGMVPVSFLLYHLRRRSHGQRSTSQT